MPYRIENDLNFYKLISLWVNNQIIYKLPLIQAKQQN